MATWLLVASTMASEIPPQPPPPARNVVRAFVVRADNEQEARDLAAANAADEGEKQWLGEAVAREIDPIGPPVVIWRDFIE